VYKRLVSGGNANLGEEWVVFLLYVGVVYASVDGFSRTNRDKIGQIGTKSDKTGQIRTSPDPLLEFFNGAVY